MIIKFKDGNTSEGQNIGLFNINNRYNYFQGSIKELKDFISCTSETTHIGLLNKYGDEESLIKLYPIGEIESLI